MITKVLAVYDGESAGPALHGVLEAEAYQVELATDVAEALTKIECTPFDVLLLDLRLGETDGLSLLKRLRETAPGAVGIILTGHGSLENAVQAMRAGADDFLVMPSDLMELKASISRALHRRAQEEERTRQIMHEQAARAAAEAARQHLHELFMQAPAMIAVVRGPEHVVELVNPLCLQAMGSRDPSELLGTPLYKARSELSGPEYFERLDQVYATGQPYVGHEVPARIHRRGDGLMVEGYFNVVLQPLRSTQGQVDGIVTFAVEVSEYVRARQRAEELDRLKEEFIATASHDLKSPLTSIRGYAQLLRRRLSGPAPDIEQMAEGVRVIDERTAAMARLLDDLLDASRIQGGQLELWTVPSDLGECLETILARLNPEERSRVAIALPDALLAGEWETKRIEQVLANVIGNALKYSPESERVSVTVDRRAEEIEVAVGDRGMGIPPEELSRLFARFHRTPQALASGLSGTGLGLYICRGIVVAHGGRIWAESPGEGQGATFRFTLPVPPPEPGGRRSPNRGRSHGKRST
jgi:signal transduction histidine kinase